MKHHRSLLVAGGLVWLTSAPAWAGIADSPLPELVAGEKTYHVYSVPFATSADPLETIFACTSTDSVSIQVCVEVFTQFGTQASNNCSATSLSVAPGNTVVFGTQPITAIPVDSSVNGSSRGAARIVATSKKLVCTVFVADKYNDPPTSMVQLTIIARTKQKAAN